VGARLAKYDDRPETAKQRQVDGRSAKRRRHERGVPQDAARRAGPILGPFFAVVVEQVRRRDIKPATFFVRRAPTRAVLQIPERRSVSGASSG
jgi:hypothetical protein